MYEVTEIKISQLADNTTGFLSDIDFISVLSKLFEVFIVCTVLNMLKVDIDKTKALLNSSLKQRWMDER